MSLFRVFTCWRCRHIKLLIVDDVFPSIKSPFRYEEYLTYMNTFPNSSVITGGPAMQWIEGRGEHEVVKEFKLINKHLANRISCAKNIEGKYDIVYVTFYNNMMAHGLGITNEHKFIVNLYPGGGFRFNDQCVDDNCRKAFHSENCLKVIVTQEIVRDYLVENDICPLTKIEYIYGVCTPRSLLHSTQKKMYYGYGKSTLDICFVSHKYMPLGKDKGYDIFIEVAKKIHSILSDVQFHVVGEFNETDIDVSELEDTIHFYGVQPTSWFENFYRDKDIILSPNVPYLLSEGSFDGFPTASVTEAGLRNVAMFVTDILEMNRGIFKNGKEIVIVKHDVNDIVQKILFYKQKHSSLRQLAKAGGKRCRKIYSKDKQVGKRIDLINSEYLTMQRVRRRSLA